MCQALLTIQFIYMNLTTYRTQVIEVPIISGGSNTKFPDQPQLDNAIVFAFEIFTGNDISVSPLTGSTMAALTDIQKANLLLVQGNENKGQNIPLLSLHQMQNASNDPFVRSLPRWNGLFVSWTKCYVNTFTGWSANGTIVFQVYYAYPEDLGFQTMQQYFDATKMLRK